MKDKKLYYIIHASCIVIRHSGIKELDTFSFLFNSNDFEICTVFTSVLEKCLQKQIDFYNEFCPEDYVIKKFECAKFEQVGEIWL